MKPERQLSWAETERSPQISRRSTPVLIRLPLTFLFVAFIGCWAVQVLSLLSVHAPILTNSTVPFWFLAATVTLVNLARRLPVQNVLSSAAIVGSLGLGLAWLAGRPGLSSALDLSRADVVQHQVLLWCFPLFWITIVLNGRSVARLVLNAWPRRTYAGFWTLGLASFLIAVLALSGEYFIAASAQRLPGSNGPAHGNAVLVIGVHSVGWVASGLITLVLVAPWLIDKRPVKETWDTGSLAIWMLLNLYLVVGQAAHQSWFAAGFDLILTTLVAARAIRGAAQNVEGVT